MSNIIDKIDAEQIKNDESPFRIGDTVKVHTRVIEGDKERIQIFAGIIISHKGCGLNEAFTVRKISYGEGVERVFPVHSPKVAQIEVTKSGRVRRARLHYLRGRKGKQAITVKDVARVVAA
jgi:large subunit ribosomal protein L19